MIRFFSLFFISSLRTPNLRAAPVKALFPESEHHAIVIQFGVKALNEPSKKVFLAVDGEGMLVKRQVSPPST